MQLDASCELPIMFTRNGQTFCIYAWNWVQQHEFVIFFACLCVTVHQTKHSIMIPALSSDGNTCTDIIILGLLLCIGWWLVMISCCIFLNHCWGLALKRTFRELDILGFCRIQSSLIWSLVSCCLYRFLVLQFVDCLRGCYQLLPFPWALCHFGCTLVDAFDIVAIQQIAVRWELLLEVMHESTYRVDLRQENLT